MHNKVMWQEGMVLSPHHFQQAEHFFEDRDHSIRRQISPFFYGLSLVNIDESGLETGAFTLRECQGVFKDGTSFKIPGPHTTPLTRPFEESFPKGTQSLGVYLGVPVFDPQGSNLSASSEATPPRRYIVSSFEAPDCNTGGNSRLIEVGVPNYRLFFEGESMGAFTTLKLCELKRRSQGMVYISSGYVPPLIRSSASSTLMRGIKKVIDQCLVKSRFLTEQRSHISSSAARFSPESLTNFLLLSALDRFLPVLNHHHNLGHIHPEQLYVTLLEFCGALSTFSLTHSYPSLPVYSHERQWECFEAVFTFIQDILQAVIATDYEQLPLVRTSPVQFSANFQGVDINKLDQFYLAVGAQAPEADIINSVQRDVKIGSAQNIQTMVQAAMPGITLVPETHPPGAIPVKVGYKYFRLVQTGAMWQDIIKTKSLTIHFPGNMPGLQLNLLAIRASTK